MGFDVVHLNRTRLHPPHGGGGPGTGPLGVSDLRWYCLHSCREARRRVLLDDDLPDSIGRMRSFYGNFGNLVRAYTYIKRSGSRGLRDVSGHAVSTHHYIRVKFKVWGFEVPSTASTCTSSWHSRRLGSRTLDIAKALLDHGVHPRPGTSPRHQGRRLWSADRNGVTGDTRRYVATLGEILERRGSGPRLLATAHRTARPCGGSMRSRPPGSRCCANRVP